MANNNLEEYKNNLHTVLINSHFSSNKSVSGNDILEFTPEKQVNLMIIYLLMEQWESEMESSKSPYFNYENEEVKGALKTYMNVLSKNILIKKNDFESLLKKAIEYTIQLVENPESFIIANKLEQNIPKLKKYVQYHKAYFEGDLNYEINSKLNLVTDNLKSIVEFKLEIENSVEEKEETIENTSTISEEGNITINEKLSSDEPTETLADKLGKDVQPSENNMNDKKVDSIKNAISINERFVLSNSLFDGDTEQYMNAVERLDNCESEEEAKKLLKELLRDNYENEEANKLRTLIEQKFTLATK